MLFTSANQPSVVNLSWNVRHIFTYGCILYFMMIGYVIIWIDSENIFFNENDKGHVFHHSSSMHSKIKYACVYFRRWNLSHHADSAEWSGVRGSHGAAHMPPDTLRHRHHPARHPLHTTGSLWPGHIQHHYERQCRVSCATVNDINYIVMITGDRWLIYIENVYQRSLSKHNVLLKLFPGLHRKIISKLARRGIVRLWHRDIVSKSIGCLFTYMLLHHDMVTSFQYMCEYTLIFAWSFTFKLGEGSNNRLIYLWIHRI